jgi:hypothetical protein
MPILGTVASFGLSPEAPTIGTATTGNASATVTYTAPTWAGKTSGSVTYTATSSPGGFTGTGSSPITVSGLTNGTAYTFTVTATTSYGVTGPASAASNSVTPIDPAMYESIATANPNGTQTVTFNSIPSTYDHLQIRCRITTTSSGQELYMRFNSDSSANYTWHTFGGTGSGMQALSTVSDGYIPAATTFSSSNNTRPTVSIIDIIQYASTTKKKTVRIFAGSDRNGSGAVEVKGAMWNVTDAISSITFLLSGSTYNAGAEISLYGIKGS